MQRLQAVREAGRVSLLIVDDDEASRYLLKGLLAEFACVVLEAADGREGLRLAREQKPRALFLDLDLPDLPGVEVLEALHADDATRHIPVILHTARILDEITWQRLAQDVVAFLPKKPASRDSALADVRQALAAAGIGGKVGDNHD